MDYFATSPFWISTCCNEVLRMQAQFRTDFQLDPEDALLGMTGVQFILIKKVSNTFFIIHQINRKSTERYDLQAAFYIQDNVIFKAPGLVEVMLGRVNQARVLTEQSIDYALSWIEPDCSATRFKLRRPKNEDNSVDQTEDPIFARVTSKLMQR